MINTRALITVAVICLLVGSLWTSNAEGSAGQLPGAVLICIGFTSYVLSMVAKPTSLKIKIRDLADHPLNQHAIEKMLESDPDFRSAVEYVYTLDTDRFLQFGSLVCELRYESGQLWLAEISRQFRKEKSK